MLVEDQSPEAGSSVAFQLDCSPEGFKKSIINHLRYSLAHDPETATPIDWWLAMCLSARDRILERSSVNREQHRNKNVRRVYYLSLEYLMGRMLENNLVNLGMLDEAREAMQLLGQDLDMILEEERDMGLGNGGLGRLAACFLDSLSTLSYPAVGYGIHYEFGLFRQEFVNGRQIEQPDAWQGFRNPWQIVRPEYTVPVRLYGHVEMRFDTTGHGRPEWVGTKVVNGVPWDIPVAGYGCNLVNYLRLWESRATEEFDLSAFNRGDYVDAVGEKARTETISKVLYPNDTTEGGKELRLVQQYFFVACSLRDIIRRHFRSNDSWDNFADKAAIQLNDTHPAVAVLELMRILLDEERLEWDTAWSICQRTFAYTNHTLLPEALERWSVPLFQKVLPRHLQIAFEINKRFLENEVARKWPGDDSKLRSLSLIEEGNPKMLRMAYLAVVASHSTNGVAALHTKLLTAHLFKDFHELFPERFNNKTNGVTPRRWIKACNQELAKLIDSRIGTEWPNHLDQLRRLEEHIEDPAFRTEFMAVKHRNKERLAALILRRCGVEVSPDALFDVQIKRLHEYKRQHLNLLYILTLYRRLLNNPDLDVCPRVFIFGAKAAPGYWLAKQIIHAINSVGEKINNDPRINGKLKVVFMPNYGVTKAERIIPAADVSEQISTAGKEASGTGNMKLGLNGAITLGTLDGANVEMLEEVGDENIFIFGLTVEEVHDLWEKGYSSRDYYNNNEELRSVIDWLASDYFCPEKGAFDGIKHSLLDGGDPYLVLADYAAYCEAQGKVDAAYRDVDGWSRKAILNTARLGKFSSDRTIKEYAEEIWDLQPESD